LGNWLEESGTRKNKVKDVLELCFLSYSLSVQLIFLNISPISEYNYVIYFVRYWYKQQEKGRFGERPGPLQVVAAKRSRTALSGNEVTSLRVLTIPTVHVRKNVENPKMIRSC